MNGSELRFGRIENRLNLCLLLRSQVQLLGYSPKAKPASMPSHRQHRVVLALQQSPQAQSRRRLQTLICFFSCFVSFCLREIFFRFFR